MTDTLRIVAADRTKGSVLIHFSNGTAVLFHAQFLWDVREDDGNVSIPETFGLEDEESTD